MVCSFSDTCHSKLSSLFCNSLFCMIINWTSRSCCSFNSMKRSLPFSRVSMRSSSFAFSASRPTFSFLRSAASFSALLARSPISSMMALSKESSLVVLDAAGLMDFLLLRSLVNCLTFIVSLPCLTLAAVSSSLSLAFSSASCRSLALRSLISASSSRTALLLSSGASLSAVV